MNDPLDLLRCPVTKSRLRWRDATTLIADVGGHTYPVVHGLMDFRLFDPPYRSREEEASLVELLVQAAETMDHAELVRYYGTGLCSDLPAARIPSHISHWLTLRQRAPKRLQDLFAVAGVVRIPEGSVVLDLGCGSGEAISTLQEQGASQVIGIDISLIELAFARKLLAETGREALLVAGCAEALPFSNEVFGFIYSPDVIEHVTDQSAYLREIYRTLVPGGIVLLNSPNRYSVVCPEPHVGIWGLGFLPRVLMDPCCRLLGKGPYVGKRLISLHELRKLLAANFDSATIKARESNPQASSLAGKLYHALSPWSVNMFAHFCDQHVVLAAKRSG